MVLYIDTSDFSQATFALVGQRNQKLSAAIDPHESHKTLAVLEKLLKKSQIRNPLPVGDLYDKSEIKGIVVCKGPGSYTGVRVGVVIAQALGMVWKVPVKAISRQQVQKLLKKIN